MAIIKKNIVFFCVTDYCNARCKSCSFWETKKPKFPKKEELPVVIDTIYSKLDCRFLQITGGETLTYPFIYDLVYLASKKGMIIQLMTNGSLLDDLTINKLCDAGLDILAISIDHYDDKIMEDNRGISGLPAKIRKNMKKLKKTGLLLQAGICISAYNIASLEKTAKYAMDIGFDEVYFCWPMKSTRSTYKIGNSHYKSTQVSNEQIVEAITAIIRLKRKYGNKISHTQEHLDDALRYYKNKKQKFTCKAGENLFYLDNHLDIYRCMTLPDKLGSISGEVHIIKNAHCDKCPLQCFREPSIGFGGIKSIPIAIRMPFNKNYWKLLKLKHPQRPS